MSTRQPRTPRSMLARARAIFNIINYMDEPFTKTKLTEAKINPKAAENWLDLIVFIQNQPKIRVTKTKRNTVIEKIGGKFSQMSLNYFLDEDQPIEKRLRSLEAYADSIIVQQRLLKID
ncbi:MAG: hypothetical protein ACXABI_05525 [Candidatus Hodarchaeales archaeon]|jgi:hypothetical protein